MKLKELFEAEERSVADALGPLPHHWIGNIDLVKKNITSLEGCPSTIQGWFCATGNYFTSLNGGPHEVARDVLIYQNKLESLIGGPTKVGGAYDCSNNKLKSLVGAPKEVAHLHASNNQLESLEGVPRRISRNCLLYRNNLKSLKGIHKQIDYIGGHLDVTENPIESHVLGVLRIEGLKEFFMDNDEVQHIISKYLEGDRDIFACQEELIEKGFADYAQL